MKILLAHPFSKHHKGDITVLKSLSNLLNFSNGNMKAEFIFYYKEDMTIIKRYWLKLKDVLKADLVIFPTRDDLSLTYKFPAGILYGIFLAIIFRKQFMLFAAQIGPFGGGFRGKLVSSLAGLLLNRANLITVRDRISRQELFRIGVTKPPIYVTADPGFLLQPISSKKAKMLLLKEEILIKGKNIGVNASALAYKYAFPEINSLEKKRSMYVSLMSRMIDHIIERLGATVVLVPHVFGQGSDDRTISREIYHDVKNKGKLKLISEEREPEEIKGIIGLFDMFITTRYHPLVHSTSMHVPTIGIDYTFKMKETMEELSCSNWLCHINNINVKGLTSKIDELWSARKQVRKTLEYRIKQVKKRSALNAELFQTFIENLY